MYYCWRYSLALTTYFHQSQIYKPICTNFICTELICIKPHFYQKWSLALGKTPRFIDAVYNVHTLKMHLFIHNIWSRTDAKQASVEVSWTILKMESTQIRTRPIIGYTDIFSRYPYIFSDITNIGIGICYNSIIS